ncbi:MAG: thioredoxin-like domain-containing protein [Actinomycetota bacterium]
MRRILFAVVLVALIAAACTGNTPTGETTSASLDTSTEPSAAGTTPAPEFPDGLDWLNVDGPLSLGDLRGKVVLLDFWTYGCINCIHIIPDLKRLEAEFPNDLVVIGVHSAKFDNESDTDNIREIIRRYDLRHPVVNDAAFEIWDAWGARAWPTVALIDPAGNAVGTRSGEGVYEVVQPVVAKLLAEFSASGGLGGDPIPISLERDRMPETPLSYPGKVLADSGSNRLFVADTGHHQIIAATDDGTVTGVYGSGLEGFDDGPAAEASFSSPQGLAVDDNTLYVADTSNHAVRAIDLATGTVSTLAGTGEKGWPPVGGSVGDVALNSPWALELSGDALHVANAGTHQIWTIDLAEQTAQPSVGSAAESTKNGPLLDAALAQPSGLALGPDGILYFADSESSSIRSAEVGVPGGVTALVAGGDANLFSFGDEDGVGNEARLQHPLGITVHGDRLIIADTYNSKIKAVDPLTGETTTLYGGEHGWRDGTDPLFYEPGGVSADSDVLWVADTNNHVIRRIDLSTGAATTLVLSGLDRHAPGAGSEDFRGKVVTLATVSAGSGPSELVLDVDLPDGYKVNEDASSSLLLSGGSDAASFPDGGLVDLTGASFPVIVPIDLHEGLDALNADLALVWCREDAEGLCLLERVRFEIPLNVAASGPSALIRLPLTLETPEL